MRIYSFVLLGLLTGCSLLSGYSVTFTTVDGASVDPAVDTLDFVVSAPVLAYISEIDCEGSEEIALLPVVTEDMQVKTAHNLSLSGLAGQTPGTECDVTVTAFDQTTTSSSRASIELVIAGEVEEVNDATAEDLPVVDESSEMPVPGENTEETVVETEDVVEGEVELEAEVETVTEEGTAEEVPAE